MCHPGLGDRECATYATIPQDIHVCNLGEETGSMAPMLPYLRTHICNLGLEDRECAT